MATLGVLAIPTVAGTAAAQEAQAQGTCGKVFTNNLFERKNGVMTITYGPWNYGETVSMRVLVSAATKAKYDLPSTVIMKGAAPKSDSPERQRIPVKSTAGVAKKLKGVKTIKGVTYEVTYSTPVVETVTKKVTLYKDGTTGNSNIKLVELSTSGCSSSESPGGRG